MSCVSLHPRFELSPIQGVTACRAGTWDLTVTVINVVWDHKITWFYGSGTSLPGCALRLALHVPVGWNHGGLGTDQARESRHLPKPPVRANSLRWREELSAE